MNYNFNELEQELDLAADSILEARARWELQDAMNRYINYYTVNSHIKEADHA